MNKPHELLRMRVDWQRAESFLTQAIREGALPEQIKRMRERAERLHAIYCYAENPSMKVSP